MWCYTCEQLSILHLHQNPQNILIICALMDLLRYGVDYTYMISGTIHWNWDNQTTLKDKGIHTT